MEFSYHPFKILAGFPITMALLGTSFVTTAPAPILAFSPITTGNIVALLPIIAPFLINVPFQLPLDPVFLNDGGFKSFIVMTP